MKIISTKNSLNSFIVKLRIPEIAIAITLFAQKSITILILELGARLLVFSIFLNLSVSTLT